MELTPSEALNFITEHQIDSYADWKSRIAEISATNDEAAALKTVEHRLANMAVLIKDISTYKKLRPLLSPFGAK